MGAINPTKWFSKTFLDPEDRRLAREFNEERRRQNTIQNMVLDYDTGPSETTVLERPRGSVSQHDPIERENFSRYTGPIMDDETAEDSPTECPMATRASRPAPVNLVPHAAEIPRRRRADDPPPSLGEEGYDEEEFPPDR